MMFDPAGQPPPSHQMQIAPTQLAVSRSRSSVMVRLSDVRARFAVLAALAASADLLTKALATRALGDGHAVAISDRLALMLIYNTGGAGGVTIGPYGWALNMIVTMAAIVMVARIVAPLAAVDPRATLALGLVTGGAFGNLASMIAGPKGVADFLAVHLSDATIVMNVADLLLWSGAALLVPVVIRLVGAVRAERSTR